MGLLTKKQIIFHSVFTVIISALKIYQIIFVEGFFGNVFVTIFKKVGLLLVVYWAGILLLSVIKKSWSKDKIKDCLFYLILKPLIQIKWKIF